MGASALFCASGETKRPAAALMTSVPPPSPGSNDAAEGPTESDGSSNHPLAQEETRMSTTLTADDIRTKIKEVIANVADLDPAEIGDHADLRQDLNLDSLSLLEIGVDVDYAFQLGIEDLEDRLANLKTLDEVVALVEKLRAERQPAAAEVA